MGLIKLKSEKDFLLAGSRLGYFTHVGCLAAVIIGAAATMGSTTLGYDFGVSGFWFVTMMGVRYCRFRVYLLLKRLLDMRSSPSVSLLGKRYGEGTQLISATVTSHLYAYDRCHTSHWNGKCYPRFTRLVGVNFDAYWWRDRTLLY